MKVVNVHEAKTHLSRLIAEAADGEAFTIARAGKPIVKVSSITASEGGHERRIGFLRGKLIVPEDFDRMGQELIEALFSAER